MVLGGREFQLFKHVDFVCVCVCAECGGCHGIFVHDFSEGSADWIYKKMSTEKYVYKNHFLIKLLK